MIHQTVYDTSRLLSLKGIRRVVLSPGSRNAPLTISFARNPDFKIYNIIDERSAGFIALGMAQKLNEPVILCCTSGTSLLNYAPAIAEAFYQQIPLIVLSADRPPEWQGQRDGQTIAQPGSLTNFVKRTFELPSQITDETISWEYTRKLNEAVNLAQSTPRGPVHINVPFREPFYPDSDQKLDFSEKIRIIEQHPTSKPALLDDLLDDLLEYERILIIAGQGNPSKSLNALLEGLSSHLPVISDIISNVQGLDSIMHQDLFLAKIPADLAKRLQPDLIISFGKSVISKNLKLFLRNYPPQAHWHFDESEVYADPFKSMSRLIPAKAEDFFSLLGFDKTSKFSSQVRKNYQQIWKVENDRAQRLLDEGLRNADFSEFKAFNAAMKALPKNADIHLANSMPVRYANFIHGLKPGCVVYANRGTSGIDGSNGAAVGNAIATDRMTVLLSGDLSFFYDRNAFFHHYDLSNLRIVVFNNGGGGIFRLIKGPADLPELEQHFETRHKHSAKFTALEYGFDYFQAKDDKGLELALAKLFDKRDQPALLEIFTSSETNASVFSEIKQGIRA